MAPRRGRAERAASTVIEPVRRLHWPDLARALAIPRHALLPGAAGHRDPLQADGRSGSLWVILQPIAPRPASSRLPRPAAKVPSDARRAVRRVRLAGMTCSGCSSRWACTRVSDSDRRGRPLISKIWFPRLIIPLSAIGPRIIDFAASPWSSWSAMLVFGVVPVAADPAAAAASAARAGARPRSGSACGCRPSNVALPRHPAARSRSCSRSASSSRRSSTRSSSCPLERRRRSTRSIRWSGMVELFRWTVLPRAPFPGSHALPIAVGDHRPRAVDRADVLRAAPAPLRRCHLSARSPRSRVEGVGKRYGCGQLGGSRDLLAERLMRRCSRPVRAGSPASVEDPADLEHAAPEHGASSGRLRDVSLEVHRGEVGRAHRPQRRRQEHDAQAAVADHAAHRGPDRAPRPGRRRCSRSGPAFTPS